MKAILVTSIERDVKDVKHYDWGVIATDIYTDATYWFPWREVEYVKFEAE